MHRRVTFRGMEHSPVVEKHIYGELEKLSRFLNTENSPIYLDVVLDAERDHHHHRVEIRLKSPNYDLVSHYECQDMNEAINTAVDKMEQLLRVAHGKLVDEAKKIDKY